MNTLTGDHPIQVDNGSDIAGQVALVKLADAIHNNWQCFETLMIQVGQLGD